MSDSNNYDANKSLGWICDYRSLMTWQWYKCPFTTHLFLHCIRKANRKDTRFQGTVIRRGSFITSYETLAYETGLTVRQVRTALDNHLLVTGELSKETTNRYTVITVTNYDQYQVKQSVKPRRQSDKQTTNKRQAERQTNDIQTTTNNNINNITRESLRPLGAKLSRKTTQKVSSDIASPSESENKEADALPPLSTSEWLAYCEHCSKAEDETWSEWARLDNGRRLSSKQIKAIRESLSNGE